MAALRGWLAILPLAGLCLDFAVQAVGRADIAAAAWTRATPAVLGVLMIQPVTSLAKGDVGLDPVVLLSIGDALVHSQPLAGAVIALMYTGGQSLEAYAASRTSRAMSALIARQPRTALREDGGALTEMPLAALVPGDRILVRVGGVLPVDGRVAVGRAVLDGASLTGEALPVIHTYRLALADAAIAAHRHGTLQGAAVLVP